MDGTHPPPHGMSIIFSSDDNFERTNFQSFRWEKYWPSSTSFLDRKKGIIVTYASPVDKKTGIIGDFGLTLYLGKSIKIKNHFTWILDSQKKIFSYAEIGMSFKDVYLYAESLFKKMGLSNDWWINITDRQEKISAIPSQVFLKDGLKKKKEYFRKGIPSGKK